ncbi:MAG: hypothetical protein ACRDYU_03375 [Actinomycetes bacterium]
MIKVNALVASRARLARSSADASAVSVLTCAARLPWATRVRMRPVLRRDIRLGGVVFTEETPDKAGVPGVPAVDTQSHDLVQMTSVVTAQDGPMSVHAWSPPV